MVHRHSIFAIERRGENHKGDGGFTAGINKVMYGAPRDINNIAQRQIDPALFHHQVAVALDQHHRAVVQLVQVRLFPVTDLHDVMARSLPLAESGHFDVFVCAEGILNQHFFKLGLLEFRAVLESDPRCR